MKPSLDGYDDDKALAAEFVLGLLPEVEIENAEKSIQNDPIFRAEVAAWRDRFAGLVAGVAPVNPPAKAKRAVNVRLFARKGTHASGISGFFIGACTALLIAAAVLVIFLPPKGISLITALSSGQPPLTVLARTEGGVLDAAVMAGGAASGRSLELWVLDDNGAPQSLGVLSETGKLQATLDANLAALVEPGTTLAISDEPLGGAPGGQPTGGFLAASTLVRD